MKTLSWIGIFRLGLIQAALGSVVVLTTSTLNRVMKVELGLLLILPASLVALHSIVQISRPVWGHISDVGGRRSRWVVSGMAILCLGGILAATSTLVMTTQLYAGIALAVVAYLLVGLGVGAAGTSLLAMLAAYVDPGRRAAAASIVWLMMIFGFVITTASAGALLEPFTFERLVGVCSGVSLAAFVVSVGAVYGVEPRSIERTQTPDHSAKVEKGSFWRVFNEVWADADARAFTVFVFVSMLAYNTQDIILEPFAGAVFGLSPGASTKLTSVQHSGVLVGMLLVAFAASGRNGGRFGSTKVWTVGGCLLSGLVLFGLAISGFITREPSTLRAVVAVMGLANGAFAVAAIGWMMSLASVGGESREGIRMGLWGGAQAVAFAFGGFLGALGVDLVQYAVGTTVAPYAAVFVMEGLLFFASAVLAARMTTVRGTARATDMLAGSLTSEELDPGSLASARTVGAGGE